MDGWATEWRLSRGAVPALVLALGVRASLMIREGTLPVGVRAMAHLALDYLADLAP